MLTLALLLNIFSVYVNNYVNHLVDVRFFSSVVVVVMMFWFILIAKILIVGAGDQCQCSEFERSELENKLISFLSITKRILSGFIKP